MNGAGMQSVRLFWNSNVGKKIIMAATGVGMVLFVIQHMLSNLMVYQSNAAVNNYAYFLKSKPGLVWSARAVLLVMVVLHIVTAVQLYRRALAARPVGYQRLEPQVSSFASRTIRFGGLVLLGFIVFHLLHLTGGVLWPSEFKPTDAAGNMIRAFQRPGIAALYVVAMVALGLHLYHGIWSGPRSVGVPTPPASLRKKVALVIAVVVAGGFISIPLGALAGLLTP
jgi:succinate dehydrogenase / fumarate reductase cytochrome b subunit